VTAAHEVSDRFSDAVLEERGVFQAIKKIEMKELLDQMAEGHITLYKKVSVWEKNRG
jgi:sorting nexin-4